VLSQLGGFDALHVPHKGGGPSVASVVAGQTHFTFAPAPAAMSQVKAGRLRAIGQSLSGRTPMLGDIPAVKETLPGYEYSTWAGMVAPKGTPKIVLDRVHAALVKTVTQPVVIEAFSAQGAEIAIIPGEEYRKYVAQDVVNTLKFVQAAGLKQE
jgi:tripartite-type tricarboxylate transporter receptor subunit TctC